MDAALARAVEVAISLDQPLLLTGEPGTGKTLLAYKVAHELANNSSKYNFQNTPLKFNTKTGAAARDLFYTYDALGHFQAANLKKETAAKTEDFIELQALGEAIALTNPTEVNKALFQEDPGDTPRSSVVLIDEVDKAPRDFTNDILHEIENYDFKIKELDNYHIKKEGKERIVIIMTSNSEKNLPDAFLRRCVFYHIPFPNEERLREIAKKQLGWTDEADRDNVLDKLIKHFMKIRRGAIRKPPATAELIAWLRILEMDQVFEKSEDVQKQYLRDNLSVLVKTKEDFEGIVKYEML